jgi:hypothetical protein
MSRPTGQKIGGYKYPKMPSIPKASKMSLPKIAKPQLGKMPTIKFKKYGIKTTGKFRGKSNKLGHGGRAAQLKAQGVPGGVIGNLARAAHAAPGQKNYHGKHKTMAKVKCKKHAKVACKICAKKKK